MSSVFRAVRIARVLLKHRLGALLENTELPARDIVRQG